ncbi:energy-coupling factor ABC transporter ATP-binding protein, partial [Paenibacillus sepulcri]|nr:energy-coupling factor ABC transporter ATP-binding protein [Paenibacillus sepulcri]
MAAPIIEMSGVSFRYPGDEGMALRGVHLSIGKGDFIAIMGSNGSGKSTLCKSLNGLIPHYYAGDFEGSVSVGGTDPMTRSVAEMSRLVGYVYQDFENQLIRPTVFDELTFARMNFGFADYKVKAEEMLYRFGLEPIRNKYIWQLSGGQKHRVALAGALAMEPE